MALLETLIPACISAGVTLLVCLINNRGQQERTRALMEYKLEELSKKVDKHNSVIERTYELEKKMDITKEQIKAINYRINDLKQEESEE